MKKGLQAPGETGGLQAFCVCGAVRDGGSLTGTS